MDLVKQLSTLVLGGLGLVATLFGILASVGQYFRAEVDFDEQSYLIFGPSIRQANLERFIGHDPENVLNGSLFQSFVAELDNRYGTMAWCLRLKACNIGEFTCGETVQVYHAILELKKYLPEVYATSSGCNFGRVAKSCAWLPAEGKFWILHDDLPDQCWY